MSSPLLTFQRAVIYPLLDLGLIQQVGGLQGEDELPETRPEAVPVVLHHGHAVLWDTPETPTRSVEAVYCETDEGTK